MTNTKAKYFWAEPDGGASTCGCPCRWTASGRPLDTTADHGPSLPRGASVRRLTTVRFPEFEARFRRAFCPRLRRAVLRPLRHGGTVARLQLPPVPIPGVGGGGGAGLDRRSHPSVLVCTISVSANFIASILGPPPRPIRDCRHL